MSNFERNISWRLFGFLACFYMLFMRPSFMGYDVEGYLVAENIIENGSVALSEKPLMGLVYDGGVPGENGKRYGRSGFFEPELILPFYAAGAAIDRAFFGGAQICKLFLTLSITPVMAAICGVLIFSIATIFYRTRIAVWITAIYSLGTIAFPYSSLRGETALELCLLAMIFGLAKYQVSESPKRLKWALVAGMGAGLAIAVKSYAPILILPGIIFFLVMSRRKFEPITIVSFFAPIIVFSALEAAYNLVRFGGAFSAGYAATFGFDLSHLTRCLYVLFLSPAKSAFLFCPILIVGILAFRKFHRLHPAFGKFFLAETLVLIFFISTFREPLLFADEIWGSRYLFPVFSIWVIIAGAWLEAGGIRALVGFVLGGLGFLVSLPGALIRPEAICEYSERVCATPMYCRLYDPAMNAIIFNAKLLFGIDTTAPERWSGVWVWWLQILNPSAVSATRLAAASEMASSTHKAFAIAAASALLIGSVLFLSSIARLVSKEEK